MSGYEFCKVAMGVSQVFKRERPSDDFYFLSFAKRNNICISFAKDCTCTLAIFDNSGYSIYYGYPRYRKIKTFLGLIKKVKLSDESRKAIDNATGSNLISECVESAIMSYLLSR